MLRRRSSIQTMNDDNKDSVMKIHSTIDPNTLELTDVFDVAPSPIPSSRKRTAFSCGFRRLCNAMGITIKPLREVEPTLSRRHNFLDTPPEFRELSVAWSFLSVFLFLLGVVLFLLYVPRTEFRGEFDRSNASLNCVAPSPFLEVSTDGASARTTGSKDMETEERTIAETKSAHRTTDTSTLFEVFVPWDFSLNLLERKALTVDTSELTPGAFRNVYYRSKEDERPTNTSLSQVWKGMRRLAKSRRVDCLCGPEIGLRRTVMVLRNEYSASYLALYNCVSEGHGTGSSTRVTVEHPSLFPDRTPADVILRDEIQLTCFQDDEDEPVGVVFSAPLSPPFSWCVSSCLRLMDGHTVYDLE